MVSFILVVEHVGFKLTALFGVAIEIPFALGQAMLGLEAFIFRDWRVLQIVSHLPLLCKTTVFIFYIAIRNNFGSNNYVASEKLIVMPRIS